MVTVQDHTTGKPVHGDRTQVILLQGLLSSLSIAKLVKALSREYMYPLPTVAWGWWVPVNEHLLKTSNEQGTKVDVVISHMLISTNYSIQMAPERSNTNTKIKGTVYKYKV